MAHETSTSLLAPWSSSRVRAAIPERSGGLLNRGPIAFIDEIQGPATVQHHGCGCATEVFGHYAPQLDGR